jgi:DNA-binding NarL/FixJ family response regulator
MPGEKRNLNDGLLGKAIEYDRSPTIRSVGATDGLPGLEFDPIDCERLPIRFDQIGTLSAVQDAYRPGPQNSIVLDKKLLIIESRLFLRECMQRSIQLALSMPVLTVSSISELDLGRNSGLISLAIIFLSDSNSQDSGNALGLLSELAPAVPTVVLSSTHSFETMRAVMSCGAKAYIPMSVGFAIAIEAVRFVLAGGTFVPAECLLSAIPTTTPSSPRLAASGAVTSRELAVVRAIQQGKSNKIIAYDLNMCESTVKVHVRHIMKKLRAKNRTDVAIKASELLSCSMCTGKSECWSAGRCSRRLA